MIVFHVDLDNTLIYSWQHDIGRDKIVVEYYQDRKQSFMTETAHEQLKELKDKVLIVPTSTRSIEQYKRIHLGIGSTEYALVCNGGVLLVNGTKNIPWYEESMALTQKSRPVLEMAHMLLEQDSRRYVELRWVENLFLFTKCTQPETVAAELREKLHTSLVCVFHHRDKIYVVPKTLDKGTALERFRKLVSSDLVIAAGDSEFDIPMVQAADVGIVPHHFRQKYSINFPVEEMNGTALFAEEMLERVSDMLNGYG